jgi:hypothetical protein
MVHKEKQKQLKMFSKQIMLRAICFLLFFIEVSVVVLETRFSVVLFLRISFVLAVIVVPAV